MSLLRASLFTLKILALMPIVLLAQQPATKAPANVVSKAQSLMSTAAEEGKYTFILFYKQNDPATASMNKILQQSLADYADGAVLTLVKVGDLSEKALVAKYDVARAPMPMTIAVAPNGAITAVFSEKVKPESVETAFVTPTMTAAMKALQEDKLVFIVAGGSGKPVMPTALRELQSDPHYKSRLVALSIQVADPTEAKFVEQMQIDPNSKATQSVLLAPPGVMVGKFAPTATKAQIAAALAESGKCCDDPNCAHNHAATRTAKPAAKSSKK